MKKLITIALCTVMALSLVACGNNDTPHKEELNSEQVQIPNPIVDYSSVGDAKKAVDFDFNTLDNLPDGFKMDIISVIGDELVQITYKNGKNEICYRIAKCEDEISGVYNEYQTNSTVTVGETEVSVKGTDDKVNVATWTKDGLSFALCVNTGNEGIETSVIQNIIESVL